MSDVNEFRGAAQELEESCLSHASFLDNCGNDGDGEDVRQLVEWCRLLRSRVAELEGKLLAAGWSWPF